MTEPDSPYARRVATARRVEYVLATDDAGRVDGTRLEITLAAAASELQLAAGVTRDEARAALCVEVASPDELIVTFTHASNTLTVDLVSRQRDQVVAALDVADHDATWARLLDLIRARTALTRALGRTARGTVDEDAPILALLPRDWPRRLDRLLSDAGNQLGLLGLVKRRLDEWVLAATDVVSTEESA